MIGLKIGGDFLDLNGGTKLRFNLQSFAPIASGTDTIQGGFSYTITVPKSGKNLRLLQLPHRIDAAAPLIQDEPIEFHYQGIPLFQGKAYVREGGGRIKLYMILNELGQLKDVLLSELDLGGDRAFGGPAEALTTAQNHLSHDFTFFPVTNRLFFDGYGSDPGTGYSKVQNHFSGGAFTNASDQLNAMPFIRLEYLIDQIFTQVGYSLDNQFQYNDELRSLYLWNNRSFYESGAWPSSINLKNHVTEKEKVTDFFKKLMRQFNLSASFNPFTREALMIPMDDIVASDPVADWTSKVVGEIYFSNDKAIPGTVMYDIDENDAIMQLPRYLDKFIQDFYFDGGDLEFIPPPFSNFHWFRSVNGFYFYEVSAGPSQLLLESFRHREVSEGEDFKGELIPLHQERDYLRHGTHFGVPEIECLGAFTGQAEWKNDFQFRLTFYRGIVGGEPFANSGRYEQALEHVSQYNHSLYWDDDYGIYTNFWKKTLAAFSKRKIATVNLNLSLSDLLNFNFSNKIRIDNVNYIVKTLEPTFTMSGLAITKAELITCI